MKRGLILALILVVLGLCEKVDCDSRNSMVTAGIACVLEDTCVSVCAAETRYIFSWKDEDDLINKERVTVGDMEYLIDHYVALYPDSALSGTAESFITASNLTLMDPIFFFSLAGIESGWGTSKIHVKQNNPYSMGMYGDGIHNGYTLGESFGDGIIKGACYIYEYYYKNGQTTLYLMNHKGDHSFCAGDPKWEEMIDCEMRYCRKLLSERRKS